MSGWRLAGGRGMESRSPALVWTAGKGSSARFGVMETSGVWAVERGASWQVVMQTSSRGIRARWRWLTAGRHAQLLYGAPRCVGQVLAASTGSDMQVDPQRLPMHGWLRGRCGMWLGSPWHEGGMGGLHCCWFDAERNACVCMPAAWELDDRRSSWLFGYGRRAAGCSPAVP